MQLILSFFYIIWIVKNVIFCRIQSQNIITKHCFVKIGGGLMALRKCNSTSKNCSTKRGTRKTEASTDNAKSRTTAKKTSRTKSCN